MVGSEGGEEMILDVGKDKLRYREGRSTLWGMGGGVKVRKGGERRTTIMQSGELSISLRSAHYSAPQISTRTRLKKRF